MVDRVANGQSMALTPPPGGVAVSGGRLIRMGAVAAVVAQIELLHCCGQIEVQVDCPWCGAPALYRSRHPADRTTWRLHCRWCGRDDTLEAATVAALQHEMERCPRGH